MKLCYGLIHSTNSTQRLEISLWSGSGSVFQPGSELAFEQGQFCGQCQRLVLARVGISPRQCQGQSTAMVVVSLRSHGCDQNQG